MVPGHRPRSSLPGHRPRSSLWSRGIDLDHLSRLHMRRDHDHLLTPATVHGTALECARTRVARRVCLCVCVCVCVCMYYYPSGRLTCMRRPGTPPSGTWTWNLRGVVFMIAASDLSSCARSCTATTGRTTCKIQTDVHESRVLFMYGIVDMICRP